jgi:hypothetical protein
MRNADTQRYVCRQWQRAGPWICCQSQPQTTGRLFHDEPNILHYGRKGEGAPLKPGMFFTIEPMINLGRPQVKMLCPVVGSARLLAMAAFAGL